MQLLLTMNFALEYTYKTNGRVFSRLWIKQSELDCEMCCAAQSVIKPTIRLILIERTYTHTAQSGLLYTKHAFSWLYTHL